MNIKQFKELSEFALKYQNAAITAPLILRLIERYEKLAETLAFYGEGRLYVNIGLKSDLYNDQGSKARETLAEFGPERDL